jgi:hypothetical protein
MAHAMSEGFRRWLEELTAEMGTIGKLTPLERIQRASEIVAKGVARHTGLVRAFLAAVARAPHDDDLRETMAESYRESRATVAQLLGLGAGEDADGAATLLLATFDGLLIQAVLDPDGFAPEAILGGIAQLTAAAQQ